MSISNLHAVVLAGGSGTRLWPLSRRHLPKQLLTLNGGESLLQSTLRRILKVASPENVHIVSHEDHKFILSQQADEVDSLMVDRVLCEPEARNTLPAITWAVASIYANDPEALVAVFPSDHVIGNESAFKDGIRAAVEASMEDHIVTFGIKPNYPATGYGYIRAHESIAGTQAFKIDSFVEKPDRTTAEQYISDGTYSWNSGMFVFKAGLFMEELKLLQPESFEVAEKIAEGRNGEALKDIYSRFPVLSIDYGIMERSERGAVIPVDLGWNDMGTWNSYYELEEKDSSDNVTKGDVIALDTTSSLLIADKGLVATVGIDNAIVVKTADSVLVGSRDQIQRVKDIVEHLKCIESELVDTHRTVRRPWGEYIVLEEGAFFKIKRVVVNPGQKLSLQLHKHRAEHWIVISGTATVTNGDEEFVIKANESTYIPPGSKHRLENAGDTSLQIIEVQTGSYLGEDDIVRFDDIYGRT